jgi:hypothetical protein
MKPTVQLHNATPKLVEVIQAHSPSIDHGDLSADLHDGAFTSPLLTRETT